MPVKSLDPRIAKLAIEENEQPVQKTIPEQFETYEVFVKPRENKPYEHVGPVHAPNIDMAFLFAKESYSRRFTCRGMWVIKTEDIKVTEFTENEENIYDRYKNRSDNTEQGENQTFEIFHLKKRGKQHIHGGSVVASNYEDAFAKAANQLSEGKVYYNIWVVRSVDILRDTEDLLDIWETLPEKKYRDAAAYKVLNKIEQFKAANRE